FYHAGSLLAYALFFFFQAEDGIRDGHVTGVQTCALPILTHTNRPRGISTLRSLRLWRAAWLKIRVGEIVSFSASGAGASFRIAGDRKSTRLNSSHVAISYAVFCLKKKK